MIPLGLIETDVTYDVIHVEGNIAPALEWCVETFGPPGQRWFVSNYSFYFRDERDAQWFELRW